MICRGLPQWGMPFVTPDDPQFRQLATRIPLDPSGAKLEELPPEAVVLLNQSGQAVLATSFFWRWGDENGHIISQRMPGLHSLSQLDWSPERNDGRSNWFSPFLSGSKRLITPQGVLGDNSDVLPPEAKPPSFGMARGASNGIGKGQEARLLLELQLDSVIFADGLCVGPDEMGLFASITAAASEQRRIASEAIVLLRNDAKLGEVFELLRGVARPPFPMSPPSVDPQQLLFLFVFGRQAVDRLIRAQEDRDELISWFEAQSQQPKLNLHRD